jgi:hypothetical protein
MVAMRTIFVRNLMSSLGRLSRKRVLQSDRTSVKFFHEGHSLWNESDKVFLILHLHFSALAGGRDSPATFNATPRVFPGKPCVIADTPPRIFLALPEARQADKVASY